MSARPYVLITGAFFGLGSLANIVRAVSAWPLQIGILAMGGTALKKKSKNSKERKSGE